MKNLILMREMTSNNSVQTPPAREYQTSTWKMRRKESQWHPGAQWSLSNVVIFTWGHPVRSHLWGCARTSVGWKVFPAITTGRSCPNPCELRKSWEVFGICAPKSGTSRFQTQHGQEFPAESSRNSSRNGREAGPGSLWWVKNTKQHRKILKEPIFSWSNWRKKMPKTLLREKPGPD